MAIPQPETSAYEPEQTAAPKPANGQENANDAPAQSIIFSDAAAQKVKELIEEEGNPDLKLRVFVAGGGCSGFQYGFTFDVEIAEDDFAFEKFGVQMLVDAMSYQYLIGAEIDYKDKLEGSQFVIHNPNVKATCGCGSSFSV